MQPETVNELILKLWSVGESLTRIQKDLDIIEQTIANEVE